MALSWNQSSAAKASLLSVLEQGDTALRGAPSKTAGVSAITIEAEPDISRGHWNILHMFDDSVENAITVGELMKHGDNEELAKKRGKNHQNMLHVAAQDQGNKQRQPLIAWIALRDPALLVQHDSKKHNPLQTAAVFNLDYLGGLLELYRTIDVMFDLSESENLSKTLTGHCEAVATERKCKYSWDRLLDDPAYLPEPAAQAVKGLLGETRDKGTCIHDAWAKGEWRVVSHGGCRYSTLDVFRQSMRQAVNATHGKSCLHQFLESAVEEESEPQLSDEDVIRVVEDLLYVGGIGLLKRRYEGKDPIHLACRGHGLPFAVVKALAMACPAAIFETTKVGASKIGSAYEELMSGTDVGPESAEQTMDDEKKQKMRELFRYLCVKLHFENLENAEVVLYKELRDARPLPLPKLFFDITTELSKRVDSGYMQSLADMGVRFETTLAYVSLPKWDKSRPLGGPAAGLREGHGSSTSSGQPAVWGPYREVFRWLKEEGGVRTIIKVTVDDLGDMPHSDKAIVECISGLHVEIFDWKKTDISIDAVRHAAPMVEKLYLYCSGREPVLLGWSGDGVLDQLKNLKQLFVIFQPGPEDRETLQRHFAKFRARIGARCPALKIEPPVIPTMRSVGVRPPGAGSSPENERKCEWIEQAKSFSNDVQSISKYFLPDARVKIAIIDNGIQLGASGINVVDGKSFWRSPNGKFKDFWVDPGTHGTDMAKHIVSVCPMAELVIARVFDAPGRDGRLCPTADSVADAIQWAAEQGVDIISVSLTVRAGDATPEAIKRIRDAVVVAYMGGVAVFCSVSDERPKTDEQVFPECLKGQVIPIGAATIQGHAHPAIDENAASFLLPGVEIPSGEGELRTGSSIATALAAGLGGLLVYVARGLCPQHPLLLRPARDALENAMKRLCRGPNDKYLAAWEVLLRLDMKTHEAALDCLQGLLSALGNKQ